MSALLDRTEKTVVTTTKQESEQARQLTERLRSTATRKSVRFAVEDTSGESAQVPPELAALLRKVVEVIGRGGTVTIGTLPKELTTTTAAKMLGVSRPTLMQLVRNNELPSHKVGSHTRILAEDVQKYVEARAKVRRQGLDELRAFEDELDLED